MDENESMDPIIIQGLFEQGVGYSGVFIPTVFFTLSSFQLMGIETNPDFGGSGSSFTSAIIAIEELAKVDPSVSVLCDVHNTLVNTVIRKYGTHEQQEKWLPLLSQSKVRTCPPLYE
jgi:alkylation response protein AidB-like acyl-CoA dehydrogenase